MPTNPSTTHREYHSNLSLPATESTIVAIGTIKSKPVNGRFQAIAVIAVQRAIVAVLAVVGIGTGAIVTQLSAPVQHSISSATTAIAAIITDERMP